MVPSNEEGIKAIIQVAAALITQKVMEQANKNAVDKAVNLGIEKGTAVWEIGKKFPTLANKIHERLTAKQRYEMSVQMAKIEIFIAIIDVIKTVVPIEMMKMMKEIILLNPYIKRTGILITGVGVVFISVKTWELIAVKIANYQSARSTFDYSFNLVIEKITKSYNEGRITRKIYEKTLEDVSNVSNLKSLKIFERILKEDLKIE